MSLPIRRTAAVSVVLTEDGGFTPSDVPQAEADALIAFYDATDGPNWTNNTGWGSDPVVGNWYGVTVSGGHVVFIDLPDNNLSGNAGATLDPLADHLTRLLLYNNAGLTAIDPSALTSVSRLWIQGTGITSLDVTGMSSVEDIRLNGTALTALDISTLSALEYLRIDGTGITSLDLSNVSNDWKELEMSNVDMSQAQIDAIIQQIWDRRGDWTSANTPEMHFGALNATPSGVYQDGYPTPLDGLEMIHDLINDDDGAGITTWTAISWNGGSAP
jgi:hypothetical protein